MISTSSNSSIKSPFLTSCYATIVLIVGISLIHSVDCQSSKWIPVKSGSNSFRLKSAIRGHYIPVGGNEHININKFVKKLPYKRSKKLEHPIHATRKKVSSSRPILVPTLEVEDPLDLSNELNPLVPSALVDLSQPHTVTSLNKPQVPSLEATKVGTGSSNSLSLSSSESSNFFEIKDSDLFDPNEGQPALVPASGARRIDAYVGDDVVVYEDIYPKRVPEDVRVQWQNYQKELLKLREQRRLRRLRRLKLQDQIRRRQDPDERQRIRASRVRRLREQRARSHFGPEDNPSLFRSFLGVSPYCLNEESSQFSCQFTPSCWLAGGVPSPGCDSMLYTCCVMPSVARKDSNALTESGRAYAEKKRFIYKKEPIENESNCGLTPQNQFSKRIIGGERAKFAELPWQVHIRISSYQCGGVLLNHWYIATAAHCVHQAKLSQITVHLGEYDTKNTENIKEPLESESFKVEHITLHPEFRYMLTQPDRYDIALLKLDHPVYYRDNIIPICLPTVDYPLEGKVGVVAGWGKTDNSFGKTGTNLLHKVLVPIINNRKCRSWHKDKAISVQLHDEMFCAGHKEGRRDACLGDSGGPLVINFDGRWTLVGITSAGFGCAVEKQPGIYHKVSKTARWIASRIKKT